MAIAFVRNGGAGTVGLLEGEAGGVGPLVLNVVAAGHAMGNTLVVCVHREEGHGTLAMEDSQGNTYTLQKRTNLGSAEGRVEIWTAYLTAALAGGGGGDTITIEDTNARVLSAQVQEFSNVSPTSPVEVSAANSGNFGGGTGYAFAALPTTGGERYLVGAMGYHYQEPSDTPVIGASFTAAEHTEWDFGLTHERLMAGRRGPVAAGVYSAGWSVATYVAFPAWGVVAIALQEDVGGVPDAPSGLLATAVSSSQINLAWTDNAGDETGFKIERSPDGVSYTQIATAAADATSYSDNGLAAATLYFYRVRAYNGSGNSAYSNVASDTTDASSTGGATGVPADPSSCSAAGIGTTRIEVTWIDNAVDETGFKIERSPDGVNGWVQIGVAGPDIVALTASGLQPETTYYFRARAYNEVGNSGYSNVAAGTTFAEGVSGAGDCPVERYATVADVQRLIWSGHLAISDGSEPNRAAVEDWLCDVSQWIDRTLAWKYVVPVSHAGDREVLRPICAALVAARCWQALAGRNPGQEARAAELETEGLSRLVYNPGGLGSRLKGAASVVVGGRTSQMGRSHLTLPGTAETAAETASTRFAAHTFTDPDAEDGRARRFGLGKEL